MDERFERYHGKIKTKKGCPVGRAYHDSTGYGYVVVDGQTLILEPMNESERWSHGVGVMEVYGWTRGETDGEGNGQ